MDISNIQQLKNQVPEFLEYANPRPFHSGHFINSEGEVDWTRGRPPLTGRVRSLKALELMVSTLQRDEDREGIDYDFGGTTKYLDQKCEQNLVATLIDNRTGRIWTNHTTVLGSMETRIASSMVMRSIMLESVFRFG